MADQIRPFSYINEGTVLLVVGEKTTNFYVHAHKLSEVSTFFKAALESGFKEAGERVITLPEDRVHIIDCFVQWVYHQKIAMLEDVDLKVIDERRTSTTLSCNLYIFAEKYDIPELKRYAIINLFKLIGKYRPPAQFRVKKWYEQTSATSGLRRLVVDWYFWKATSEYLASEECHETLIQNPEFSADLVRCLGRQNLVRKCPALEKMDVEGYL